jgi:hypothetical protein
MDDDTKQLAIAQPHVQGEHMHTCEECARLTQETHDYVERLALFIEDFDMADLLSKVELPSGPMGMILRSMLK